MVANIAMFGLGAIGAGLFARLLKLPEPILMGSVLMFSLAGAFVVRGNIVDVVVCALAGIAGLILRIAGYPVAPVVIGMALGGTLETKLRQGMISARGDFLIFIQDPIALSIFGATALMLAMPALKRKRAA